MANAQKPLELILARNLLTSVSTPGFLVDHEATLVFYNEAAAALLGRSFEDAGQMSAEQWTAAFGPLASSGTAMALDENELTDAIRRGRPAHGRFHIRTASESVREIEATAFPIVTSEQGVHDDAPDPPHTDEPGSSGAMILFWALDEEAEANPGAGAAARNGNGAIL
jgi:PAS domain-containing protein